MSVRMRIHPSLRELNRLADRELAESRQREVNQHLGECQRCRDQVALMRDLGQAAREISHPSPPEDALARILERRAAGDRVILPVSSTLHASRHRKAIGIAAAIGGALIAATLLLLPANEASAGASDLRFDPAQPEPGDRIEVTYLPTSALAADEVLFLRGAFRRPGDPPPRHGLPGAVHVELRPNRDGTFSGTLPMPPDAVFGYFAVENRSASELDLKDGRFWPLLAHDNGVPTREALREQLRVLYGNDVDFGLTAARTLLRYHPDDIVGLYRELWYERKQAVGAERERVLAEHRAKLAELSSAVESGTGDPAQIEGLWRYAIQLGHDSLAKRWGRELVLIDRPVAAQVRLDAELDGKDVPHQLEAYEREWMRAGFSNDFIVERAFRLAEQGEDAEAVLRWARRHNRAGLSEVERTARALARFPSLREPAKEWIRAEVKRLGEASPDRRDLDETTDEFRSRDRRTIGVLLGTLGRLLFEEGRYAAAIDTLEIAIGDGWNAGAFRALAESAIAAGDSAEALAAYAYVVAGERDQEAQWDLRVSVRRRLAAVFPDEEEWSDRIREAEEQIDRWLLTEAGQPIRPAGDPIVWTTNGESQPLDAVVAGGVSIVVFGAGSPWDESGGLRDIQQVRELKARGIDVITITENPRSTDLDLLFGDAGAELPVYFDQQWEAARSLNALGVPYYYVVDQQGRFLYAEDMVSAVRLAESLRRAEVPAA